MEAYSFASGSKGNVYLVRDGKTAILIDGGKSCRYITACLGSLGLSPDSLSAILVTHGHTDHVAGLLRLLSGRSIPVIGTCPALGELPAEANLQGQALNFTVTVGGLSVTSVPLSHDSPGTVGYRIDSADDSFAIATDTGVVTPAMESLLPGCRKVVLEANHDPEMLRFGPYPASLKRRIAGKYGHLSNGAAAEFAVRLCERGAEALVLGHLSEQNNTPEAAVAAVSRALREAGLGITPAAAPVAGVMGIG